jgi:hypothetical protein
MTWFVSLKQKLAYKKSQFQINSYGPNEPTCQIINIHIINNQCH